MALPEHEPFLHTRTLPTYDFVSFFAQSKASISALPGNFFMSFELNVFDMLNIDVNDNDLFFAE